MKSGGPWNLRGLRPETRETARNAARRSGQSVGEWLNGVIQRGEPDYGDDMRFADDDDYDDGWRDDRRRPPARRAYRDDYYRDDPRDYPPSPRYEPRRAPPRRDYAREASEREAALAREEFGEVHSRLDRLTDQLERMTRAPQRMTGAPPQAQRGRAPMPRPHPGNRPAAGNGVTVDDAVAEIAERQRALYGERPAPSSLLDEPAPPLAPQSMASEPVPREPSMREPLTHEPLTHEPLAPSRRASEPPPDMRGFDMRGFDMGGLQDQLQYITTRIESLRPTNELERVISGLRKDLNDIRAQLTEALPRRAVESLEIEVQALAERIDHSRESGLDAREVAGLEHGLAEVRDALRRLTPAENLVGFDDAVKVLSQKIDNIVARQDPGTIEQLETAIDALRGIVSHVASNDTLNKVAEEVRAIAGKVDGLANSAASTHAVSLLESRFDTLASALHASTEAGRAVPAELEKLLSGLIEKLEWVQLTHTDHAALGQLEDRIAQLMKRLDASDAKLGNLEAVERGLADLLMHVDQIRGGGGGNVAAEIKRSERRTQESIEAVHDTVEQVVGRLAMIESDMHDPLGAYEAPIETPHPQPAVQPPAPPPPPVAKAPAPEAERPFAPTAPTPMPAPMPASMSVPMPSAMDAAPIPAAVEARRPTARTPIDPNLPPDHPLEPGLSRPGASAAERIAASEAAAGYAKPPVIDASDEKPNFIAAARRAAQAAAAAAPAERAPRAEIEGVPGAKPTRMRKLLVAGGAILVLFGFVHVALRMFQDTGTAVAPPPAAEHQSAPPTVLPESAPAKPQSLFGSGPLVLPVPGAATDAPHPVPTPGPQSGIPQISPTQKVIVVPQPAPVVPAAAPAPVAPSRQSALPMDVTGALPHRPAVPAPPPAIIAPAQAPTEATAIEKLPATIGGPTLRAAALAGDAAAEFEVATRFAEGHGVPPSNEQAARWLERAAKQGLAPAQFRLGGFYEKGIGVRKDLATARDYYKAAAEKGNGKAMHNLAVLYAEGINGPADYHTASHWFRKAADHGITDSEYNLAILYARGIGVEQNYTESYRWFSLAADAGDKEAATKRDDVVTHLDPTALAAAQAAIQKWSAEPQPDDAVNVKAPPGGWDPAPQAAKPRPHVTAKAL